MRIINDLSIEYINHKVLVNQKSGKGYDLYEVQSEHIILVDPNNGNKIITGWCGTLNEDEDEENLKLIEKYEKSLSWKELNGNPYYVSPRTGWVYEFYKLGNTDRVCCMLTLSNERPMLESGCEGYEIEEIIGWEFFDVGNTIPKNDFEKMIEDYESKRR